MTLGISIEEIVENSNNPLLKIHPSWRRVLLGDIADVLNGFAFESSKFSKSSGFPLIRIRDIGATETDAFYTGDFDKTYIVKSGDLLIGMDGDFNSARWKGKDALLNQRVCKVALKSSDYNPKLLEYVLPGYLKAINDYTSSVTVKHLSSRTIAEIPLPCPPLPEQERIVAKIEELFTQLDTGEVSLNRAQTGLVRYKASVLKAAVEGRLVAQKPEDESAEILLQNLTKKRKQRIRDEQIQFWKTYLDLRTQADVSYAPYDVLIDFVVESVINEIGKNAAQKIIDDYFSKIHFVTDHRQLSDNYIPWLVSAIESLKAHGCVSNVLDASLHAVLKSSTFTTSSDEAMLTGIGKWLVTGSIRHTEFDNFHKKYIDEPVETKWEKEIARLSKPDVENLPKLPDGWQWVRAEEICEFITKGTTPKGEKMFADSGEVPFIKVYNLTFDGTLDFSINPTFVSKQTHTGELTRSKVFPGDVLMNIVGPPLGKVSIVPDTFPEWNMNQAVARFRPLEVCDRRYLSLVLRTESVLSWAVKRAKATAGQFNLTLEICRDLPIPLPPLAEQRRIVAEVERRLSVAGTIDLTLNTSAIRAARLRRSILKLAFEGKLVPQNPQDEPASKLLERISQIKTKKDEIKLVVDRDPGQRKKRGRLRKQISLPLPSSDGLKLYDILCDSEKVLSPSELFVLAKCQSGDAARFYEELRREIYNLKRIVELRPDRTKEGTLEARR